MEGRNVEFLKQVNIFVTPQKQRFTSVRVFGIRKFTLTALPTKPPIKSAVCTRKDKHVLTTWKANVYSDKWILSYLYWIRKLVFWVTQRTYTLRFQCKHLERYCVYVTNHAICKICYIYLKQKKINFLQHSHEMIYLILLASDSKDYLLSVRKVAQDVIAWK